MACGIALLGAYGSPATGRPEAPAATSDPAAVALARDWHVPYSEAARRIGRQDQIGRLAAQLAAAHPDTLAGVWIDHANGGRVVVASVRPGIAANTAAALGLDGLVTEQRAARTMRQLQALSDGVGQAIESLPASARSGIVSHIDVPANQVVLTVAATDARSTPQWVLAQSLARRYGDAVTVRAGSIPHDDCTTRDCPPPLRGSVQINRSGSSCSAGFVVRSRSDAKQYVLTAGHCGSGTWLHTFSGAAHVIGATHSSRDSGDVDGMLININNVSGWNPQNWVIHGAFAGLPRDESFAITSVAGNGEQTTGHYLCRTGYASGTQCGAIVITGARLGNNTDLVGIRACAVGGDSGGPVYEHSTHKAFGIHVGSSDPGPCDPSLPEVAYYSRIASIQNALNVNVRTS
jgi:streptogrisin C